LPSGEHQVPEEAHQDQRDRAPAAGDATKAAELAVAANRSLDKAVSKGVIHKNQAANRKSAISTAVAAL